MPKITKRVIDSAKPSAKQYFIWDDHVKGFGIVVLPSGQKSFILQYRTLAGRSRRLTLGQYGALTPVEGKRMAGDALAKIRNGEDPLAHRRALRSAPTVNDLMDRYWSEHVLVHNAQTTQRGVNYILKKIVRPNLGSLKLSEITRKDVAVLHSKLGNTPRQANQSLSILSKAFNLAEVWGWRPEQSNPVRMIKRYKENERDRFLSDAELSRLGNILNEAEAIGLPWEIKANGKTRKHLPPNEEDRRTRVSPVALLAIRLLLLTGARLSEVLTLEWSHVDMDKGMLALPSRKGDGRKPHPVSNGVLALLKRCQTELQESRYVLPREHDLNRHVAKEVVENAWQRIRKYAGLEDVRLHDLRHTIGTFAAQAGGNAFMISHLLRHSNLSTTNRYVNTDHNPIRALSEAIGERVEAGLSGHPVSGETGLGRKQDE
ncbi:site-specific integrase [Roseibium sp. RKSG952]|uniref:tyrosine-type recombinase/integrase n=1 Tax=Roseibium sp. RKSG952 TaxID=2529384 RepID=UPI0012BBFB62|nr:site-specific integrase [Roseibium sp. RKSG952]MTH96130.1 DUF4102 domain-containing protein [Roseibium sp. RKSG952]